MLNDIKPPPDLDRKEIPLTPVHPMPHPLHHGPSHGPTNDAIQPVLSPGHHIAPHIDPKEPGLHHARIMGEPTHIDPEYAMPLEERGSNFNIAMTCVAAGIMAVVVLFVVWWAVR